MEREQWTKRNCVFLSVNECEWSISSLTDRDESGGVQTATSFVVFFVVVSQTFVSTPRSSLQVLNA